MKITAAVLRAADAPYSLEEVELADPGPGHVVVRIVGAGHCHTDLLPRAGVLPLTLPVIAGHEGAGVVEEVGPGVTTVQPGDHVVLSFASCGACGTCLDGHPASCDQFAFLNFFDPAPVVVDGRGDHVSARWFGQSSFASHALASVHNVVRIDQDLPVELMGPLGCGVQTGAGSVLNVLDVRAGQSVAVYGTGAVGLSGIMAAAAAGATTIVGVDVNPARLELARELGATHTVDAREGEVAARVIDASGGGVMKALDTTGVGAVAQAAVDAVRVRGHVALVGVSQPDLAITGSSMAMGKTVSGVIEGDAVPQLFIPLLTRLWRAGRFPFDRLVQTFPLAAINEAEQAAARGDVVKPVLMP